MNASQAQAVAQIITGVAVGLVLTLVYVFWRGPDDDNK